MKLKTAINSAAFAVRFARLYWRVRIETLKLLFIFEAIRSFARLYWRVRIETR